MAAGRPAAGRETGWRVHAGLLVVQLIFGSFHVVAKYALINLPPLALAAIRVGAAIPLLLLAAWLLERHLPRRADLPALVLLGFLGVFANQLLFIYGLQHTTATTAGVLMPSIPVFAAAAASLLGIERMGFGRWAGVLLAVAGSVVMLDPGSLSGGGQAMLGNGLLLANSLCYALYLVLQRPVLVQVPPVTLTAWAFLFGGGALVLVALPLAPWGQVAAAPAGVWPLLAYIVIFPTVVNYALNSWALKRSSPSLAATFITLQPVISAGLAMPVLGEQAGAREAAGFVLIVAGLLAVSRSGGDRTVGRT